MARPKYTTPGFEGTYREIPMTQDPKQYTPNEKPAPAYPIPPVVPLSDPARRISGDVPRK